MIATEISGKILQMQNFSVNDGDGIRTTVFFAGCPLRCQWCANPEGMTDAPKIAWRQKMCVGCGKCAAVCPNGIGIDLNEGGARQRCIACGKCVAACPTGARTQYVAQITVGQVAAALKSQLTIFRRSGGGVTFSGGEPGHQPAFFNALAQKLYDMGVSLAMETSSCYDFDAVRPGLECMDLIFADIKHMDGALHKKFTGVDNKLILKNIRRYRELKAQVVIRVPTIIGVNADEANIRATAAFVHEALPEARMELLPFHRYGDMKYESLGLPLPTRAFGVPDDELLEKLRAIIRAEGVETISFR